LLGKLATEEAKEFREFEPEAARALLDYYWPGNVRELQNVIRRIVVMNQGELVKREMLPPLLRGAKPANIASEPLLRTTVAAPRPTATAGEQPHSWVPEGLSLAAIERIAIEATIERCRGNIPEAARSLGVSPSTLYRKRACWE